MSWGKCHDCGASIHFARMRTGKVMPVDPVPDDRGNVIARKVGTGQYIAGYVENLPSDGSTPVDPPGHVRLMPHFATCSHPKHAPKRGAPRPPELGGRRADTQDALI